ncbi:hypothetical protein ACFQ0B_56350 [Nonomuraea thailandensis]
MRPLSWFCSMLLAFGAVAGLPAASAAGSAGDPPCAIDTTPAAPPPTETKLSTLRQAYTCVLDVFYGRDRLDHRQLLVGALAGLTTELGRRDLDQPDATMPALSGDRTADWAAFGALHQKIFVDGILSVGALNRLTSTSADPVRLTLRRPSTGRTWTTTLTPSWYEPTSANVQAELVDGDVAHLSLGGFAPAPPTRPWRPSPA